MGNHPPSLPSLHLLSWQFRLVQPSSLTKVPQLDDKSYHHRQSAGRLLLSCPRIPRCWERLLIV